MTQHSDVGGAGRLNPGAGPEGRRAARRWWRTPWALAALAAVVVFNLFYALPRYLQFNPKLSRVPLDPTFFGHGDGHFAVVVVHVIAGNLAMVTMFVQLVPWIRRNHPKIHRISGRVYMLGGVLPTAVLALILVPYSTAPIGNVGLVAMAVLWLSTTAMGYVRIRQHRYLEHRRWMYYSFALALGTSWGRVLGELGQHVPALAINDTDIFLEIAGWLGWIVNLALVQIWLEFTSKRVTEASLAPRRRRRTSEASVTRTEKVLP
ncbi:MFS family permease [Catenulispora sp. EB89]|uniref:DUF2306 domain-containing protein n=1 Tax=Catenulispora sp. EB89 TaxID=3156257 RepID=UPI0035153EDF